MMNNVLFIVWYILTGVAVMVLLIDYVGGWSKANSALIIITTVLWFAILPCTAVLGIAYYVYESVKRWRRRRRRK